jgi:hypothetical protein
MKLSTAAFLLLAACGGTSPDLDGGTLAPDAGPDAGASDGGSSDAGVVDAGSGLDHSSAGLTAFVRAGSYKAWRAEAAVHPSTGPHGGNVRTYVNDLLYASLKAGNTTHPAGSATVKELYGSGTTAITGYAIDAKDGQGKWFFLETFAPAFTNPYYFQGTSNFCASCHAAGPDYYLGLLSNLP